jgi:ubiquitin-large subunit ribosomal protein L40e
VGGVVRHSQRTASDSEEFKNTRRLAAMTAMRALGFEPDARLWGGPGFKPRAVPLDGVRGVGSVFVDARTVGWDIQRALAGLGVACADVEVERGRGDKVNRARAAPIVINVQAMTAKTTRIDVTAAGALTVLDLKHAYYDADGVPVEQQRIIYAGKQLEDDRPLSDLPHEATVHVVLRLTGC